MTSPGASHPFQRLLERLKSLVLGVPRRVWIGGATALALYTLLGFVGVPSAVKYALRGPLSEQVKRQITVRRVTFNPFSLRLTIHELALPDRQGNKLVGFEQFAVNLQMRSLFRLAVVLREVRLDKPYLNVILRRDGSLNLLDLLPEDQAPPTDEPQEPDAKPFALVVDWLQVSGGRVDLVDRSRGHEFSTTLAPLVFSLRNFATQGDGHNQARFHAESHRGEVFSWRGRVDLAPLRSHGTFRIGRLQMRTIRDLLKKELPFDPRSGTLDIDGRYRVALKKQLSLDLRLPRIALSNVGIAPLSSIAAAKPEQWIAFRELAVTDVAVQLPEQAVTVDKVRLLAPKVLAWQNPDGSINLEQLATAPAPVRAIPAAGINDEPPPETSSATPPSDRTAPPSEEGRTEPKEPATTTTQTSAASPWRIEVRRVELAQGTVQFEDRAVAPTVAFALAPIDVAISGFSNQGDQRVELDAQLGINKTGRLTIKGPIKLAPPLHTALAVSLSRFDLTPLQPYLAQSTSIDLRSGTFGLAGTLETTVPTRGVPAIAFEGSLGVTDLLAKDPLLKRDLVSWKKLRVTGIKANHDARTQLVVDRVRLDNAYARIIVSRRGELNLVAALSGKAPTPPESRSSKPHGPGPRNGAAARQPARPDKPAPAPDIRLRQIQLAGVAVDFTDLSLRPRFRAKMHRLRGRITGLSSSARSRAKVAIKGSIERHATVNIDGTINVLSTTAFSDVRMGMHNIELTLFNPYSGKFAGYKIRKGKLSVDLRYRLRRRRLKATHKVVIDQLEFGEQTNSRHAVDLPVKLGVALLRDRHGVIDLDVPVEGTFDDPEFAIWPIVWKVIGNLLTKAATAPFSLLASMFDSDADISYVAFQPGSAQLGPEARKKLGVLGRALGERPQLKLDIPTVVRPGQDRQALTTIRLTQRLTQAPQSLSRQAKLEHVYLTLYKRKPQLPAPNPKQTRQQQLIDYLEAQVHRRLAPTTAELEELGRKRAKAVQDALVEQYSIEPTRLYITADHAPTAEKTPKRPDNPSVRMELHLR